jgi:beta-glucosidase
MTFPEGFTWGVATASYQIEGAPYREGGGESVWDMFCRRPEVVHAGESGDVACDHHHRYAEDVALMAEIGVQSYRFSIAWPRVLPGGVGAVHAAGLDFYDRLVDALCAAGITPYVTLFHWDFPYALYLRGGWLNRDSAGWFADYTQVVVDRLSDRVRHWMTLNEPQCFIGLGLVSGMHAPGDQIGLREALLAGHHALLAHGRAVQVIRAGAKSAPDVGYAPVGVVKMPASHRPEDVEAARQAMFCVRERDVWNNSWWMDPVFSGSYPADGLLLYAGDAPEPQPGDMETIAQPLDFFGANIYNGRLVRAGEEGKPEEVPHPTGIGRTTYRWPVTPEALYWGPRFFWERYQKPVAITENGLANNDWVALDGKVHDPQRIDFLQRYLLAFRRAIQDGVTARGFFHWSLLDNFEWHEGYQLRFGLVYVDYLTQQRVPKDSAAWYREVIRTHGASLPAPPP